MGVSRSRQCRDHPAPQILRYSEWRHSPNTLKVEGLIALTNILESDRYVKSEGGSILF